MNHKKRPLLLDLFCGGGGASMGYYLAGFDVVGVDHKPQKNYPFGFIQADVLSWLPAAIESGRIERFDAIHASPPCQRFTTLGIMPNVNPESHPDLVERTRDLLIAASKPYIIENVPGAPLNDPVQLCGSSFGIRVRKHRLFELSHFVLVPPCQHDWQDSNPIYDIYDKGKWHRKGVAYVFGSGGQKANKHWAGAMGIVWMTQKELSQAIPPAYTRYLGEQLLKVLKLDQTPFQRRTP